jgi:hypothetical protein
VKISGLVARSLWGILMNRVRFFVDLSSRSSFAELMRSMRRNERNGSACHIIEPKVELNFSKIYDAQQSSDCLSMKNGAVPKTNGERDRISRIDDASPMNVKTCAWSARLDALMK